MFPRIVQMQQPDTAPLGCVNFRASNFRSHGPKQEDAQKKGTAFHHLDQFHFFKKRCTGSLHSILVAHKLLFCVKASALGLLARWSWCFLQSLGMDSWFKCLDIFLGYFLTQKKKTLDACKVSGYSSIQLHHDVMRPGRTGASKNGRQESSTQQWLFLCIGAYGSCQKHLVISIICSQHEDLLTQVNIHHPLNSFI